MINDLYLYGDLGSGWWAEGIEADHVQLALFSLPSGSEGLDVHINTYGGDVSIGLTIMNLIRSYHNKQKVLNSNFVTRTIVDGFAYSAGTIVMLAADVRIMNPGTKAMIHNPLSMVIGDYREMNKASELLKKSRAESIDLYVQVTGKEEKAIGQMMDDETYLSADEALQLGLATEVIKLESSKKESNRTKSTTSPDGSFASPQDESRFFYPSSPYEANQKVLDEVAKLGRGAYQKSLLIANKKCNLGGTMSLAFLQKELESFTICEDD